MDTPDQQRRASPNYLSGTPSQNRKQTLGRKPPQPLNPVKIDSIHGNSPRDASPGETCSSSNIAKYRYPGTTPLHGHASATSRVPISSTPARMLQQLHSNSFYGHRHAHGLGTPHSMMLVRTMSSLRSAKVQAIYDEMKEEHRSQMHLSKKIASSFGEKLIESVTFSAVVYLAIVVNAVQLGLQLDYPQYDGIWWYVEYSCGAVFLFELFAKVVVLRWKYFKVGWNIFDCTLVSMSVFDTVAGLASVGGGGELGKNLSVLRILRMIRVVRVLRLLKVFRQLWLVINGIMMSLEPLGWIMLLLAIIIYMSGIFVTMYFDGREKDYPGYRPDWEEDFWPGVSSFNPEQYFGSLTRSMFSLFNLLILAEWIEFSRAVWVKDPIVMIFFVLFVIFNTFGVMNILVSIIVENTLAASEELKTDSEAQASAKKLVILDQLRDFVISLDHEATGSCGISQAELEKREPDVLELLQDIGFPAHFKSEDLFNLMNRSGEETLRVEDFMNNAFRLVSCERDPFQFHCMVLSAINSVYRHLRRIEVDLSELKRELKADDKAKRAGEVGGSAVRSTLSKVQQKNALSTKTSYVPSSGVSPGSPESARSTSSSTRNRLPSGSQPSDAETCRVEDICAHLSKENESMRSEIVYRDHHLHQRSLGNSPAHSENSVFDELSPSIPSRSPTASPRIQNITSSPTQNGSLSPWGSGPVGATLGTEDALAPLFQELREMRQHQVQLTNTVQALVERFPNLT